MHVPEVERGERGPDALAGDEPVEHLLVGSGVVGAEDAEGRVLAAGEGHVATVHADGAASGPGDAGHVTPTLANYSSKWQIR